MNGSVTKLWNIDSMQIPEELLQVHVDEKTLEENVQRLGLRYAKKVPAESAEPGDVVFCGADREAYADGRTILLYTGVSLPGAEEAAKAVLGKIPGDTLKTCLAGKDVTLTVTKILRREPVEVNDALAAGLGLEGVQTLSDYRDYLRRKMEADQKLENGKAVIRMAMDEMEANSSFVYDETAMEDQIQAAMAEYAAQGPMDDEMPPMNKEELRQAVISQIKQGWLMEAFCRERGIAIDEAAAQEEADQMAEMSALMGESAPDRQELLSMARQNQCFTAFFDYLDRMITEKMGGSYGDR